MTTLQHYRVLPHFPVTLPGDGHMTFQGTGKEKLHKFLLSHRGEYVLKLEKPKKRRTNTANAYYWSVIIPIVADYMGEEDAEDVDRFLEAKFLRKVVIIKGKQEYTFGRCSKLTTPEFWEYVDRISTYFAREHGLEIPPPDHEWATNSAIANGEFG